MMRLLFASLYTALILPGLILAPPVEALMSTPPSIGHAAGIAL